MISLLLPLSASAQTPNAVGTDVPGAVNVQVTQDNMRQTICKRGWTRTVRPPVEWTDALKQQLLDQGEEAKYYELDHLVPLEVAGCPNCKANLWLQPWHGHCNAKQKDELENRVNRMVCSGQMTLVEGQYVFRDWRAGYTRYVNPRGC